MKLPFLWLKICDNLGKCLGTLPEFVVCFFRTSMTLKYHGNIFLLILEGKKCLNFRISHRLVQLTLARISVLYRPLLLGLGPIQGIRLLIVAKLTLSPDKFLIWLGTPYDILHSCLLLSYDEKKLFFFELLILKFNDKRQSLNQLLPFYDLM